MKRRSVQEYPDSSSNFLSNSSPGESSESLLCLPKRLRRDDGLAIPSFSNSASLVDLSNFPSFQKESQNDFRNLHAVIAANSQAPQAEKEKPNSNADYAEGILHLDPTLYPAPNLLPSEPFSDGKNFDDLSDWNHFPILEPKLGMESTHSRCFSPTSNLIQVSSDATQSTLSKTISGEDYSECNSSCDVSLRDSALQALHSQDASPARAFFTPHPNAFVAQLKSLSQTDVSPVSESPQLPSPWSLDSSESRRSSGDSKDAESNPKALSRRPPDLSDRLASLVRSKSMKPKKPQNEFPSPPLSKLFQFPNSSEPFPPIRVPFPVSEPASQVNALFEMTSFQLLNRNVNRDLPANSNSFANNQLMNCGMFQSNDITQISIPKMILRDGLLALAKAIATHDDVRADKLMAALESEADSWGCTMQRITAHFLSALSSRRRGDGHKFRVDPLDVFSVSDALTEFCLSVPYLPFWIDASIGCMYDSIESCDSIHIIDFAMWLGFWPNLLRKIARKKDNIPIIRFTAIEIPMDAPRGTGPRGPPETLERELATVAERLGIRFEFRVVHSKLENLSPSMLDLKQGESVVVYSGVCLEKLLDSSVIRSNPRDSVLKMIRSLNPRVMVMCNLESSCNSPFFLHRFKEVLDYYIAIYDSHDSAVPRTSLARHLFEGVINKPQIMEIVACEGTNRYERAERLETWASRLMNAGLVNIPPSQKLRNTLDSLLDNFPRGFRLLDNVDFLYMGWKGIAVVGVSAWKPVFVDGMTSSKTGLHQIK